MTPGENPGGLVENVDFRLPEMEIGSFWMTRAITENLEHQASTKPEEHARAQAEAEKPASGCGDGYAWKDEGEELEVILDIPDGINKKDQWDQDCLHILHHGIRLATKLPACVDGQEHFKFLMMSIVHHNA